MRNLLRRVVSTNNLQAFRNWRLGQTWRHGLRLIWRQDKRLTATVYRSCLATKASQHSGKHTVKDGTRQEVHGHRRMIELARSSGISRLQGEIPIAQSKEALCSRHRLSDGWMSMRELASDNAAARQMRL